MLREYYYLTKPGIIRGNLITAGAGFFLASMGSIDWWLLLVALGGLAMVIASGCVFNNYIDCSIDAKMDRTKKRALVQGKVSAQSALVYGTALGLAGVVILGLFANWLTAVVAASGWFFYVVVYSIWKRRSVYSTIVGSISGAVPPVVGYTAVSGQIDAAAAILFSILVLWQMPHFYAIGIYRRKEYAKAGIPILPVKQSLRSAQFNILVYIIVLTAAASLLSVYGYTSYVYSLVAVGLGMLWLWIGFSGIQYKKDERSWAKQMFRVSLLVLAVLSAAITIDSLIYQGGV